ncbi:MAG: hypothetical protein R2932_33965 [Caldilineaceae bacterium]
MIVEPMAQDYSGWQPQPGWTYLLRFHHDLPAHLFEPGGCLWGWAAQAGEAKLREVVTKGGLHISAGRQRRRLI